LRDRRPRRCFGGATTLARPEDANEDVRREERAWPPAGRVEVAPDHDVPKKCTSSRPPNAPNSMRRSRCQRLLARPFACECLARRAFRANVVAFQARRVDQPAAGVTGGAPAPDLRTNARLLSPMRASDRRASGSKPIKNGNFWFTVSSAALTAATASLLKLPDTRFSFSSVSLSGPQTTRPKPSHDGKELIAGEK
jgi:hypothetical protein